MANRNQATKKNVNKVEVMLGVKQAAAPRKNATEVLINVKAKCDQKQQNPPRRNTTKTPMAVVSAPDPNFIMKQQQTLIKQQNAMLKQQQTMLAQAQKMLVAKTSAPKAAAKPQQTTPKGRTAGAKLQVNVHVTK